jgi:hypothetical protein
VTESGLDPYPRVSGKALAAGIDKEKRGEKDMHCGGREKDMHCLQVPRSSPRCMHE